VKELIQNWLNKGCDYHTGIALLKSYASELKVRLIESNPSGNKELLIYTLCQLAGLDVPKKQAEEKKTVQNQNKFREEFPFLNTPACPIELKALVTDKFTSFYAYRDLHKKLRSCASLEDCARVSKELIENYIENKAIYAELEYFKANKTILGQHPIFKHYKRMKDIRKLSIKDLVKKQMNLQHNIWRIESELKKADKPELDQDRKFRLEIKKNELNEVNRMLGE
jgi:hypothetical protein